VAVLPRSLHVSRGVLDIVLDPSYIAGQVQLTKIGRDLINWIVMLAEPKKAIYSDPRRADIFRDMDLSMENMFQGLNARPDDVETTRSRARLAAG
jgi:hypothetical protein